MSGKSFLVFCTTILTIGISAASCRAKGETITLAFPQKSATGKLYLLDPIYTGYSAAYHFASKGRPAQGSIILTPGQKVALVGNYALGENMVALKDLPPNALADLDLRKLEIQSKDLASVAHLTGLQELNLDVTDIDDGGMKYLAGLTNLQTLGLSHTLITGTTLQALEHLPALTLVDVGRTGLNEQSLSCLAHFKKLQKLFVDECKITDKGLEYISEAKTLEVLSISENHLVTNKGFKSIGKLHKLSDLAVRGTPVDIDSFVALKDCPLERVQINEHQLSQKQLAQLKKMFPRIKFEIKEVGHVPVELFKPLH